MPCFRTMLCACLAMLLLAGLATAQRPPSAGLAAIPNLGKLTQKSGYIFSGTVTSVARAPVSPGDVATMQITFRVQQAVRGVQTGQLFTIREWAGLWDAGERYRPGERVMLFLYPNSRLGLTSPVGGPQGRLSIDTNGQVINGQIVAQPVRIKAPQPVETPIARPSSGSAISTKDLIRIIQQAGRE
jgi:hypothetical protein